jgi:hypothetical protein
MADRVFAERTEETAKSIASRGHAELAPVQLRTLCRCPSALSGVPRVAWLASRTGAHQGAGYHAKPRGPPTKQKIIATGAVPDWLARVLDGGLIARERDRNRRAIGVRDRGEWSCIRPRTPRTG